ncbi:ATPase, T2SS/T4P/T4SS family [Halomonas sp. YLGW01]|uniref:GspE/PulE family protein n=1 Tax=Halomonas sp. YLGW01 TaxID=2773308 RepID=UPI00177C4710|nr:ATPase, T2SS/T4P/T4SS family [Halomonas sp. YLGW01]
MPRPVRQHLLKKLHTEMSETSGPRHTPSEAMALLDDAELARATDIHLDPLPASYRLRLRIDGMMVDAAEFDVDGGRQLVNQLKVMAGLDPLPSLLSAEGSFSASLRGKEFTLRVTAVNCFAGEKLAIRFLAPPLIFEDIEGLGISGEGVGWIKKWMDATGGMLLVTGPTGSGKTTTLYTLLHRLSLGDSQVMTLEDPVEYSIPGINQIQVDDAKGLGFYSGTLASLRLDPDYVLIGEIRDSASAQAAFGVSVSGRSVMGTLHSRDAVGAVSTLRQRGLEDEEIASNLGVVVAQRLVRRLCERCRRQEPISEHDASWLDASGLEVPERVWVASGCDECDGLGFRGRTGIFEVWQPTQGDHGQILRHIDEHKLRHELHARGERLMFRDGLDKAERGVTTLGELFRVGALLPV